ncbi:unnamed protein product [Rotaria sp. Silwood2]|nr:unnamed protein product [Rotaria sp. Silwood2]
MTDINNNAHDLIKSTTIVSKSKHLSILEWFWRLGKQWWQLEIQETEHVDALDQLNICDPFTRLNSDDLLDQKRLTDITSATTTVSSELPFSSTLGEYLYQEVLLTNTFHIYIKSCREIVNLT